MLTPVPDLLLQVSQISSELHQEACRSDEFYSPDTTGGVPQFPLSIPPLGASNPGPTDLLPSLISAGAPFDTALELSEIHSRRCTELSEHYAEVYSNICLQIAPTLCESTDERASIFARLQRLHLRLYNKAVASWVQDLLQSVRKQFVYADSTLEASRRTFNADFAPVLERYFAENPSPPRVVREALARSSGMTVRQINVWFQNHRARTRRETLHQRNTPPLANDNSQETHSLTGSIQQAYPRPESCDEGPSDSDTLVNSEAELSDSPVPYSITRRKYPLSTPSQRATPQTLKNMMIPFHAGLAFSRSQNPYGDAFRVFHARNLGQLRG
ncbi:hypothetical protein M0805_003539 [Coniferiporia weirii]|nr:hypothetical protein M0805_003539 [Coniferiporia weirii]